MNVVLQEGGKKINVRPQPRPVPNLPLPSLFGAYCAQGFTFPSFAFYSAFCFFSAEEVFLPSPKRPLLLHCPLPFPPLPNKKNLFIYLFIFLLSVSFLFSVFPLCQHSVEVRRKEKIWGKKAQKRHTHIYADCWYSPSSLLSHYSLPLTLTHHRLLGFNNSLLALRKRRKVEGALEGAQVPMGGKGTAACSFAYGFFLYLFPPSFLSSSSFPPLFFFTVCHQPCSFMSSTWREKGKKKCGSGVDCVVLEHVSFTAPSPKKSSLAVLSLESGKLRMRLFVIKSVGTSFCVPPSACLCVCDLRAHLFYIRVLPAPKKA